MSAFLTLDSLSLATPDGRRLFDGLTLAFGRERTGLVGRNGSGKSTLLNFIASGGEPAAGSVLRRGSVGALAQVADETLSVDEALGVAGGLARLRRMEAGAGSLEDAAEADWTLEGRIAEALAEVGLPGLALDRRIATLSGGERTRVAIARLLIEAPDLLLLDEPTNNLDADGRAAIAELLARWKGGAIVASHDRALLEHVDRIVELTPVGVAVFGGGWSAFEAARDAARLRAETELERAADALKAAERAVQKGREKRDRRDAAGRAYARSGSAPKIVLGGMKRRAEESAGKETLLAERLIGEKAEALDEARSRVEILTPLHVDLPSPVLSAGRLLLSLAGVEARFGARRLFGPLSLEVRGPERIAVAGRNGAGKSTLLRIVAGELAPAAGEVRRPGRVAMLDQHVGLLEPAATILDNMRRTNPGLTEFAARSVLARFAFRNDAALQVAGTLSGGERLRAGLACVFAGQPPDLLILDEPTNHLDLAAIEQLEAALKGFRGALMLVSHDRAFLQAIGVTRTLTL
ncbi:MAG: ATP-binding cassette domain-containing protein [Caulobacteraceae bacterium]|nr:ATP-binding cassette domain-containing protein [Caulobacteraceae bacterium]